ncbi:jg10383 [Pararge aegeria aegeria]|uniref:Jg10383 protein n=1 Tax=Pararge aegeria aegeria TaxID=348720 RepID=A0A8S4SB55_9NEOP|nr:jg10383 [Pararge aegeria aegeria]
MSVLVVHLKTYLLYVTKHVLLGHRGRYPRRPGYGLPAAAVLSEMEQFRLQPGHLVREPLELRESRRRDIVLRRWQIEFSTGILIYKKKVEKARRKPGQRKDAEEKKILDETDYNLGRIPEIKQYPDQPTDR